MSTAESTKTLAGRPWPNGDPATWVYVDELPMPPAVLQEIEETCRQNGWVGFWRWWHRREIETEREHAKCLYYFLGKQIVYEETPRGKLILIVGEPGSDAVFAFREATPADERERRLTWTLYDESLATDWYHV